MEKDLEPQVSSKIVCFSSYTQISLSSSSLFRSASNSISTTTLLYINKPSKR